MQSGIVLLFVYNIDRGNLSGMTDYHQRLTSSKTPQCNLYTLIFSPVGMKKAWKRFINDLSIPSRFLYRDDFLQIIGKQKLSLPSVYVQSGKSFHELINTDEIKSIGSTDVLIGLVTKRLTLYLKENRI